MHGCPFARIGERDTGGMNVFLKETSKELGRRGIAVDIFTRFHDPHDPQVVALGENARVIHLAAGPLAEPKHSLAQHLPSFTEALREYTSSRGLRYDVVHGHYWLSGPPALTLAREQGAPAIASFHTLARVQDLVRPSSGDAPERGAVEERIAREADVLVSSSAQEREQLLRLYGARPERCRVAPCGYDASLFRPMDQEQARRALGLTAPHVVLFVGRMEKIKGIDILLRAVAMLEEREEVEVLLVGGGEQDPERHKLAALARELGLESRLRFVGRVPQEELPAYYNAADVCVAPSFYETFGMVALEAMACGTPVIAARVGGLQSTVQDGASGFLVPWHCPEPYAERLETVLGNVVLRRRLAAGAEEAARDKTWQLVADRLLGIYEDALAGRWSDLAMTGARS